MKRAKQCCSDFVKTFDVFTSPVGLRYDKQPMYDTVTGGCFSIAMIVLLISVFFNQWIDILNYAVINSNEQNVREFDPSKLLTNSNQFMFALGIVGLDLNSNDTKYVKIEATATLKDQNRINNYKTIPMQKCRPDHWSPLGDEFASTFSRMSLQTFVCPPVNYSMHFEGKFTSANFAYIKIALKKCSGVGCKTTLQFDNYIAANTAFYFNVYYVNTLVNKDQLDPIQPVFEDKTYVMASSKLAINMNLYLSEYEMSTDQTLWPWNDIKVEKGIIVDKNDNEQWNYIPSGSTISNVYLRKGDNKIYINRSFRKLDDMLSYIGGLFGIIAVVVGVLLTYYSQCSYQLALSSDIFQYKQEGQENSNQNQNGNSDENGNDKSIKIQYGNRDGIRQEDNQKGDPFDQNVKNSKKPQAKKGPQEQKQLDPSNFNFLDYLKYLVFILLKAIGCKPKWKKSVMVDDTLDEMRNQMNIDTLFKKISFFDKAIHALFDQEQLKLLYLQEKYNIIDIKKERQMLGMGLGILSMFIQNNYQDNNQNNINQSNGSPTTINHDASKIELRTQKDVLRSKTAKFTMKRLAALDMLVNALKKRERPKNEIPQDIEKALDSLNIKISTGDQISKRIYQGLDPKLIEKYQKRRNDHQKPRQMNAQGPYVEKHVSIERKSRKFSGFMGLIGGVKHAQVANQFTN